MILVDYSQIIHNQLYIIKGEMETNGIEESINFLKHLILTQIIAIGKKYSSEKEVVLCADWSSWRKEIHPNYKGRRKLRKEEDGFDWDNFWEKMSAFEKELAEIFPFIFIKIHRAEGDDVIATLVYHILDKRPDEKIYIISNDKDLKQLHVNSRVKQFDPKNKEEITSGNYKNELMWLILKGDVGDDIPNVRTSNLNVFVTDNERQKTIWKEEKIWKHIHENTVFEELLVDENPVIMEEYKKNFERNKKLIDLRETPDNIKSEIIRQYYELKNNNINKSKMDLLKYFTSKNMRNMLSRLNDFNKFYGIEEERVTANILDEL